MRNVANRNRPNYTNYVRRNWYRLFGSLDLPELVYFPHHYTHAYHSFVQSPFDEFLCLTMDGSGDTECTVLWRCRGDEIQPLKIFRMPHSLGWFFGAITEYLGFQSRDGEYKVMGMAAYVKLMRRLSTSFHKLFLYHTMLVNMGSPRGMLK